MIRTIMIIKTLYYNYYIIFFNISQLASSPLITQIVSDDEFNDESN